MEIIISWLVLTAGVLITAYVLPGIGLRSFGLAFVVALVLGVINAVIKPILIFLTLPINFLTLGLFTFVINALLIMLVAAIIPGFDVRNFWWALLFSIVLAIITWLIGIIFG